MAGCPGTAGAEDQRARLGPLAHRSRDGGRVTIRIEPPTVRIGLSGDGRGIAFDSLGGLHIVDSDTGQDVWKSRHRGVVRVVRERGDEPEAPQVYRVQVASLGSQEAADALKARLEDETGEGVDVSLNPDRNAWRVRVGQRGSQEEIGQVEEKLRELGFSETWVVQETVPGGERPRMRLVDRDYNDLVTPARALLVLPATAGRPVQVDGNPYRGAIEVLLTRSHHLKAVNIVNEEEYLRGVVPVELGPEVFPELEALKAQAVAARTYVEANRGQFAEDGYDICDTARCQVYGGMSAEHSMSDIAVDQTSGIMATYGGEPINAMYTSTCGGHTEDLQHVFPEMEGPYLKGVRCYPEEEILASIRRPLKGVGVTLGSHLPGGESLDEAVAMLEVLGVLAAEEASAEGLAGFPAAEEIGRWTTRTLALIGKKPPEGFLAEQEVSDLAAMARYLVEAFAWQERLSQLLVPADLPSVLGQALLEATPEESRRALAYMVKEGISPLPRAAGAAGPAPGARLNRAEALRALYRMILRYEATGLRRARYRGFQGEAMILQEDERLTAHALASRLHLFVESRTGPVPVAEHLLQDGDRLRYHLAPRGTIDFLRLEANSHGASDDRYSPLHTWEERISREELETRIRKRASIGELIDLEPGRRGVSGRIIELKVRGSKGRYTFRGFSIEGLLGLRETLFLVDRQYDDEGKVETFIFSGKGWGHGVGMCQVGAFGMALRGKTYEEILHHYYTGITLGRLESR